MTAKSPSYITQINYKSIWLIAYPIVLGSLAQNILQLTDTAFLGHLSTITLGAAAIGSLFYFSFVMVLWGLSIGTQIIIARRLGENALQEIGMVFKYTLILQLLFAALFFFLMQFFSTKFFHIVIQSDDVLQESVKYIKYRSWGILFSGINLIFRALYIGVTRTRIIGISTFLMAIINISLDYVLIFGKWGFPFMGIEGAALASVIAEFSTTIIFIVYTKVKVPLKQFGFYRKIKIKDPAYFRSVLKISFPIMIQLNLSVFSWFIFFLLIEKMGEIELAVSNIIRSLYIFLMMPVWGFASAANTLTSQLIGRKLEQKIFSMINKCISLNLLMVATIVGLGVIFSKQLLRIYTTDVAVLTASLPVFYLICVAAFFFAVAMTFFQALSGTGKTLIALFIEIITISVYLFLAYLFINVYNQSLAVVWSTDIIYAIVIGIGSYLYLKYGSWREKNLI